MTSEEKNRIELAAELYAQGRRDGWLAALAAVEAKMPKRGQIPSKGWNSCAAAIERIVAALREEAK